MKTFLIFALAIFATSFWTCTNCNHVDCEENDQKLIRFISKIDSTDLIISQQYSLDSLHIIGLLTGSASGKIDY